MRARIGFVLGLSLFSARLALAASDESFSDFSELSLEDVLDVRVTTATMQSQSLAEAPGSITVITRQQITDTNARTLRDVLNVFVPGFDVVPAYFRWGDRVSEGIYGRGLLSDFSQQVLVLYNGQTKFNESTFSTPFPAIEWTLENVERIEVSRTPIPLYGGSSIFVVNLITRERVLEGAEAYLDASAWEKSSAEQPILGKRVTGIFGATRKGWHLGGSAQYSTDRGQWHPDPQDGAGGYTLDPHTLRDGMKGAGRFTLEVHDTDERVFLESQYSFGVADAFLSGLVASQSSDLYKYEGRQWLTNLRIQPKDNLRLTAGLLLSYWSSFTDYLGLPYGGDEKNLDAYVQADYRLQFSALGSHSLLLGARAEREGQYAANIYAFSPDPDLDASIADQNTGYVTLQGNDVTFAPNATRHIVAGFLEDTWRPREDLTVLVGARLDQYFGYGNDMDGNLNTELTLSPRVAAAYTPAEVFTLKATYASATRPPSIYERKGKNLLPLLGSPDVKSERVQTFELSGITRVGGLRAQVTPFVQLFQNKIEYVSDGASSVATNNGTTLVEGLDVDAFYYFTPRTYVFGNASYLFKSYDEEDDHDTYFLPRLYVSGGFNLNYEAWNWNTTAYVRGERELPPELVLNRENASGVHVVVNSSVAYVLADTLKLYLLLENLSNHENNVPLSMDGMYVPMRRRTLHAGFVWNI